MKDGILYEPSQVPNGNDCGCFCPGCQAPLIARQGAKTPHFAHTPDVDCSRGLETIIHFAAKQLIAKRMELSLPRVHLYIPHFNPVIRKTFHEAQLVKLEKVFLEKPIGDMRPDIVAIESGREILIEIAVTHFVDEVKQGLIRKRGSRIIEIDASSLRGNVNFSALEALLFGEPRKSTWLYHPEIEFAYQECLANEVVNRKQEELAKQLRKLAKEASDEEVRQERKRKLALYRNLPPAVKLAKNMKAVGIDNVLVNKLTSAVRGEQSFLVSREVWQTAIIAYISNETKKMAYNKKVYLAYFYAPALVSWLEDAFEIRPVFPNAHEVATWEYLKYLEELKLVRHLRQQEFEVMIGAIVWQLA
jgi:hypothetical protein